MQMANQMRGSGAGVVVVSCSDPRLNPYQILGLDQSLSKLSPGLEPGGSHELIYRFSQKRLWFETQGVVSSMPYEPWLCFRLSELQELSL